jgi:hypothetical protein
LYHYLLTEQEKLVLDEFDGGNGCDDAAGKLASQ